MKVPVFYIGVDQLHNSQRTILFHSFKSKKLLNKYSRPEAHLNMLSTDATSVFVVHLLYASVAIFAVGKSFLDSHTYKFT